MNQLKEKQVNLLDSYDSAIIFTYQLAEAFLVIPLIMYFMIYITNKLIKTLVPKEDGYKLKPHYFYVFLIVMSIETIILRHITDKLVSNNEIAKTVMSYFKNFYQNLIPYYRPSLMQFMDPSI